MYRIKRNIKKKQGQRGRERKKYYLFIIQLLFNLNNLEILLLIIYK